MNLKKPYQEGFSLIELAISLIIIGILATGILKAQTFIENAKIKKIISQIQDYQIAFVAFLDKYSSLPGDFMAASQIFGEGSFNGNQNGKVEGNGLAKNTEALAFWQHLFLAGFINSPGIPQEDVANFGEGAPSSPLGGGYTIGTSPIPGEGGVWLILGNKNGDSGNSPLLTPLQAYTINKKLEDGNPLTGEIQSREGQGVTAGRCISQGKYNLGVKEATCVLYIHLQ